MGAVSGARFESGRVDGFPVAVNMVWMVANTTVHAESRGRAVAQPSASEARRLAHGASARRAV